MRIIRNYILKELLKPFILSLVMFTFVMLMGNLIKLADLIINKGVNIIQVIKLFFCFIPYLLSYTIPMSLLTAILLAFGRLSSENEITAMKAVGISLYKLFFPVLTFSLLLSIMSVFINNNLLPKSHYALRRIIKNIGVKNPTAYLEAGTFIKSFKDYIVFIYKIENNILYNIRIYQPQRGKPTRTIVAKKGYFNYLPKSNSIHLKLIDGTSDEPNPSQPANFYKLNFKTYALTLNLSKFDSVQKIDKKPKDMTIKELKEEIKKLSSSNIEVVPLLTEIHKKLAMAFAPFVFAIIAFPLSIITKRSGTSIGFGISLIVLIIYYLMFAGGTALALEEILPPLQAIWLPNIIFFLTGVILMKIKHR